ncbi:MAG: hypothetical protein ACYC3G_04840, partial [Minisyncoccota bacterium]
TRRVDLVSNKLYTLLGGFSLRHETASQVVRSYFARDPYMFQVLEILLNRIYAYFLISSLVIIFI